MREAGIGAGGDFDVAEDRKSTRLNSSHQIISYAVFCLKKKKTIALTQTTVVLIGELKVPQKPHRPTRPCRTRRRLVWHILELDRRNSHPRRAMNCLVSR